MTKFVGRRGRIAIGRETSRGVAASTLFWTPWAKASFDDRVETAREMQGLGVIADSDSNYVTQKMSSGNVEAEFYDKALGIVLTNIIGAAPSTAGGGPYTHTYTLSNTNQHASLSILYQDPDTNKMYTNCMIDKFRIEINQNAIVEYKMDVKGKVGKDWTTQTPSYTSLGSKFLHQHLVFKLAANVGSLGAASAISLKKLVLNFDLNAKHDTILGTVEPEDVLNEQLSVSGELELNKEDETYRNYMLNGTYRAMDVTISSGSTSSLQFQMPRVDFTEWEQDRKLNNIVDQKIQFKCNYDAANALDIISTCVLINQQSSY